MQEQGRILPHVKLSKQVTTGRSSELCSAMSLSERALSRQTAHHAPAFKRHAHILRDPHISRWKKVRELNP